MKRSASQRDGGSSSASKSRSVKAKSRVEAPLLGSPNLNIAQVMGDGSFGRGNTAEEAEEADRLQAMRAARQKRTKPQDWINMTFHQYRLMEIVGTGTFGEVRIVEKRLSLMFGAIRPVPSVLHSFLQFSRRSRCATRYAQVRCCSLQAYLGFLRRTGCFEARNQALNGLSEHEPCATFLVISRCGATALDSSPQAHQRLRCFPLSRGDRYAISQTLTKICCCVPATNFQEIHDFRSCSYRSVSLLESVGKGVSGELLLCVALPRLTRAQSQECVVPSGLSG